MNKRLGTLVAILVLMASAKIGSAAQSGVGPTRQPPVPCRLGKSPCVPKPCHISLTFRCVQPR